MQLTVRDAARYLNVPEETVYRWINDGAIPFTRINEQYRLTSTDLMEWASERGIHVSVELVRVMHGDASEPDFVAALAAGGVHALPGVTTREAVLEAIVQRLPLDDPDERETLLEMVLAREVLGSTGIGGGIAVPHVRAPIVVQGARAAVSLWYLDQPVDFESPDGQGIVAVFLLITPSPRVHLHLLARVASALHDAEFRGAVMARADEAKILELARALDARLAQRPAIGKG